MFHLESIPNTACFIIIIFYVNVIFKYAAIQLFEYTFNFTEK